MEIKLKDRNLPRNAKGDIQFKHLGIRVGSDMVVEDEKTGDDVTVEVTPNSVLNVFTPDEVVELVNRALYQLEYQRESHRKRGQAERDRMKTLKAALKAQGKDVKATLVDKQLKGE